MLKIAINGFGRIGRSVLRSLYESPLRQKIQVVAINEVANEQGMAHLLKYDSTHGRFGFDVEVSSDGLVVDGDTIALIHQADINALPWNQFNVDIVLECTGVHNSREAGEQHLKQGAKKVLFSHPSQSDVDGTVIYGVNHHLLKPEHRIVSNGSCTTNCIVPVIQTLDKAFGVTSGTITTIHSSMNDQQVIDAYHDDLRLSRAASQSIIPVNTKLAAGIERILPKFKGKFEAISVRVPTINVTAMDLSVTVDTPVTVARVNQAIVEESLAGLSGILGYTEAPLVSMDFNHDPRSSIVDGTQTRVSHKHLVKTLVWCDNEWGFANRLLDTALAMYSNS